MSQDLASAPVDAAEFAALMQTCGPFEPAPRLAVAVSGGADSLALALLADRWARARDGSIVALTVDHRLRPGSDREAAQVGDWLVGHGIEHRILVRIAAATVGEGGRYGRGGQASARFARYGLLERWCAESGILHLLVAHHRQDQAETVLLRLSRGSGLDGLAGMSPVVERAACRLLRPLLGIDRARLVATLRAARQDWIEDPSNQNPAYARVRLRQVLGSLEAAGLAVEQIAQAAVQLGRDRAAIEKAVAACLARGAFLHPAGFARLDPAGLLAAPEEVGKRALAAVLTTIGGSYYPPRRERLDRLYRAIPADLGRGRTLGGCRVMPRREGLVVYREPAAVAPPLPAPPGATIAWDGRFRLRVSEQAPSGLEVGALGAALPVPEARRLPSVLRASLPALFADGAVVAVPALRYVKAELGKGMLALYELRLRPTRPLTGGGFTVV